MCPNAVNCARALHGWIPTIVCSNGLAILPSYNVAECVGVSAAGIVCAQAHRLALETDCWRHGDVHQVCCGTMSLC